MLCAAPAFADTLVTKDGRVIEVAGDTSAAEVWQLYPERVLVKKAEGLDKAKESLPEGFKLEADASEAAILNVYGVLALVYRVFLFFSITLYVMGQMFALGLILAFWTAARLMPSCQSPRDVAPSPK